jgi:hypothetical protein
MRGYKFLEFEKFLKNCKEEYIELTFKEIEGILHENLSPSAYNYEAYWYFSETHTFPNTWINAGYKMYKLNLKEQKVSFIRSDSNSASFNVFK